MSAITTPIKMLLKFDGQWRTYQKRVLDRADNYLKDKRIHIVAAPGSGKTTLGIELIRRLNAPALILSPSINIRNQWIQRIESAYLPKGTDTKGILSTSLKEPALITAITYQALHSASKGMSGKKNAKKEVQLELSDNIVDELTDVQSENEQDNLDDYTGFNLEAALRNASIKTICLDEAHHLRSEWWKALEELIKDREDITVISLTATPPYDSTKNEWERYIGLCGPIDEEIIVPELVKEKSLCPHQDYVYFNMPTEEETEAVSAFRKDASQIGAQIFEDAEFSRIISNHVGVCNPKQYTEVLLDKPEYLSTIIVFLNAKKIPFSKDLVKMLGTDEEIPSMNLRWLEILLQGFLYDDVDSYICEEQYREDMIALLKGHGLIQKKKVGFTVNDDVNKLLTMSKGKIKSIVTVVGEEYKNLGADLRLLVLTDYIKKEYMSALGDETKSVNELGVVPIFENIRRAYAFQTENLSTEAMTNVQADSAKAALTDADLRIAALSGSIVIIPESAKETLESIMNEKSTKGTIKECSAKGYYQVNVSGSEETASGLVTELFNRGEIRVLIGTKSLLGEGWDSPCINSLILASFVGSFMLSNQMRGRAIRTMKDNPNKVSNIWHLICMEPAEGWLNEKRGLANVEESEDFATLKRRFEGFLGVHYEKDVIENGLERLSFIKPPYTAQMLEKINGQMLQMAANRSVLKKRWEDSLVSLNKMEVAVEAGADKKYFKPGIAFFNALVRAILCVIAGVMIAVNVLIPFMVAKDNGILRTALFWGGLILTFAIIIFLFKDLGRLLSMATPYRFMESIGKGILRALREQGIVTTEKVSVAVDDSSGTRSYIYLKGGTEREKDEFAQAIYEFFGVVDNQRYILKSKRKVSNLCRYYCVPEVFGRKKEDAEKFVSYISKYIGPYELVYTRNGEGRRELLEARIHSFSNKNQRCTDKRKKVKSGWQ